MASDWEALLIPQKNPKLLLTGLAMHRLTGRKDVIQMLHKMNSTAFCSDIIQQNKIWADIAVSRKAVPQFATGEHLLKKNLYLGGAMEYPVTSVPLGLANPDSDLKQNPKHHFRNYLIDVSKACESTPLNEARWIIDSMSIMRAIKV